MITTSTIAVQEFSPEIIRVKSNGRSRQDFRAAVLRAYLASSGENSDDRAVHLTAARLYAAERGIKIVGPGARSRSGWEFRESSDPEAVFRVIAVSQNANSFGYKGVKVLCDDGRGFELMYQAYGTDPVPTVGQRISESDLATCPAPRELKLTDPGSAAKIWSALDKREAEIAAAE